MKDAGSIDQYPAKLDGTSGHIVLEMPNENLAHPQIAFVPLTGTKEDLVLPVDDIVELKKVRRISPRNAMLFREPTLMPSRTCPCREWR